MDEAVVTSIITINYFWRFYYETFSSFIRNSWSCLCHKRKNPHNVFIWHDRNALTFPTAILMTVKTGCSNITKFPNVCTSFLNFLLIYRVLNFASELWIFHSPFPRMILFFLYQKNHLIKEKKTPLYFHES